MTAELKKLINQRPEKTESARKDGFAKSWEISRSRLNALWSGQTQVPKSELIMFLAFDDAKHAEEHLEILRECRLTPLKGTVKAKSIEM